MTEATSPSERRPLSCFVTGDDPGVVGVVTPVLRSLGIEVVTSDQIRPGSNFADAILNAILSADFVCLVMTRSNPGAAVMYEAGIAAGSRRPCVTVLGPAASMAENLVATSIVRLTAPDSKPMRTALEAYVKQIQPLAEKLKLNWEELESVSQETLQSGQPTMRGSILEQRVMRRLGRAGAFVHSQASLGKGVQADGLATFPTLGNFLSPLVIECKARVRPTHNVLHRQNIEAMHSMMNKVGAHLGILVYGGKEAITERDLEIDGSLGIWVTSIDQLEAYDDKQIVDSLTILRNRMMHSF